MSTRRSRTVGWLVAIGVLVAALAGSASSALAAGAPLAWKDCGDGFECATVIVPRDYDEPHGATFKLALIRMPATDPSQRIGTLFTHPGGPSSGVDFLRGAGPFLFPELNRRFDIVAWDQRGLGASRPAVNCGPDPGPPPVVPGDEASEAAFVAAARRYAAQCGARNRGILPHVGTTNTVRDLDRLRALVGDAKLTFAGASYGTRIGAEYATLFPGRARALALDGALDLDTMVNRPLKLGREQTAGFERALGRFFQACAAQQDVCGFGGTDPWMATDELLERLDLNPIPAPGAENPEPVTGDDLRFLLADAMYAKPLWPELAGLLRQAQAGDGTRIRQILDAISPVEPDGSAPGEDQFVAILAVDSIWPARVETYLRDGRHSVALFDHFGGYEFPFALWPAKPKNPYFGPIENPARAATALVVGTTYDPATPYVWARRLTADLGNARLLTLRGDGHIAYANGSPDCIDTAVNAYLTDLTLPAPGTVCRQDIPFAVPPEPLVLSASQQARRMLSPRVGPGVGRLVR